MKKFEVELHGLCVITLPGFIDAENAEIANGKFIKQIGAIPNKIGGYAVSFENVVLPNGLVLETLDIAIKGLNDESTLKELSSGFDTVEVDDNGNYI